MNLAIDEKEYRFLNIPAGDLRISITNKCNMKCVYCHNEGQKDLNKSFMSFDEFKTIVENSMKYGVSKIRITGGEPLLHPEIKDMLYYLNNDLNFHNVGINTNGVLNEHLTSICKKKLVNRVVIGMDYFDGAISKQSSIGIPSNKIKETALMLKQYDILIEIAIVYSNYQEVYNFIKWGLENEIGIKVIEQIDYWNNDFSPEEFDQLIVNLKNEFNLKLGITADLKEYYLTNKKTKIKFFQSHCNRNECDICKRLHMRITCDGRANPCINREDTTCYLLNDNFDENMQIAIANLGIGPDEKMI